MKIDENIIAHRGVFNNRNVPENSLLAFKRALRYNYPIELDVQLTKDNILVVFHDFNLLRMTSVDKILSEENYHNIENINLLNTNQHIPKFSEVLDIVKDQVLIDIEIKNTKRIKDTCNILFSELNDYNCDKFIVKSFNPRIVRYIRKHYPNVTAGLLIGNLYRNKLRKILAQSKFALVYSKAKFIAIDKELLKSRKFNKLSLKYPTLIWTINSSEEITSPSYIYICNNLPYSGVQKGN